MLGVSLRMKLTLFLARMAPYAVVLIWTCFVSAFVCDATRLTGLTAFLGSTPSLDGHIVMSEWSDALHLKGIAQWNAEFSPVRPSAGAQAVDLDVEWWLKHDGTRLFFAFRITDDLLYRIQETAWNPVGNPQVNDLNQTGWPWFGDEVEILLNANNTWSEPNETVSGDTSNWQMVLNLAKSRLGGLGVGGLFEGEPRSSTEAWSTYNKWILSGAQQAATQAFVGQAANNGSYYEFEWSIAFDPCVTIHGVPWSPQLGARTVGLNIALGDVDTQKVGDAYFGIHHENWISGRSCGPPTSSPNCHTFKSEFAQLLLDPSPMTTL
jgi:SSS family solute:Na+ symporter